MKLSEILFWSACAICFTAFIVLLANYSPPTYYKAVLNKTNCLVESKTGTIFCPVVINDRSPELQREN